VARLVSGDNSNSTLFRFPSTPASSCKAGVGSTSADNDILVCDSASGHLGQLLTTMSAQNYGLLSMRPRQPFDFSGRTGTIAYNVDALTEGPLSWWTSVFVTDDPTAGANNTEPVTGEIPRNGFGLNFDDQCNSHATQMRINHVYTYANYAETLTPLSNTVCVQTQRGSLNHIEVRVSQTSIEVWASDFSADGGQTFPNFRLIGQAGINLGFTTGYVHFQEEIRAPLKYATQANISPGWTNNYWSNLGFDGPALPVDTGYEVADALTANSGGLNLGYALLTAPNSTYTCCPQTTHAPLALTGVDLGGVNSAMLTFSVYYTFTDSTHNASTIGLQYRLNGGAWQVPNPPPDYSKAFFCGSCPMPPGNANWSAAYAFPVPMSALVQGTNTLEIASSGTSNGWPPVLANIDLLTFGGSVATPTPTATRVLAAPTLTPTATAVPATATTSPTNAPPPSSGSGASNSGGSGGSGAAPSAAAPRAGGGGGGGGGGPGVIAANSVSVAPPSVAPPPRVAGPTAVTVAEAVVPPPVSQPAPQLLRAALDPDGGQLATSQLSLGVPPHVVGAAGGELNVLLVDPQSVPAPRDGFQLGATAFVITVTDAGTGSQLSHPPTPLTLEYRPSPPEISQAGGDLSRMNVATFVDGSWVALGCAVNNLALECAVPNLSLFALVVAPAPQDVLDEPVTDGWFYKQANGFNGAGNAGFAVVDDADASLWTEFQRRGGVERLGYPITNRFLYGGLVTQVFQRVALQWRADLGQAVPAAIFDDLGLRGADAWLDTTHQVPPAADASGDDSLVPEDVIARHVGLLDAYPALRDFYLADPDPVTTYGLPLSVKDYGPFVTVRLQSGFMQLWTSDAPWAPAGSVVVGSAGEVAEEAGLWPPSVGVPGAVPATAADPGQP
jgi:hypothetical protein